MLIRFAGNALIATPKYYFQQVFILHD